MLASESVNEADRAYIQSLIDRIDIGKQELQATEDRVKSGSLYRTRSCKQGKACTACRRRFSSEGPVRCDPRLTRKVKLGVLTEKEGRLMRRRRHEAHQIIACRRHLTTTRRSWDGCYGRYEQGAKDIEAGQGR